MEKIFNSYNYDFNVKLANFEKFVRRQSLTRFMARYEIFKMISSIKGSVVECGVHYGGGVMAWAKLSAILEPYAIYRKIIGFDTFSGFPQTSPKDKIKNGQDNPKLVKGGLNPQINVYEELTRCIKSFDKNRYLSDYPKIELVKGDAAQTIPEYVKNNPHLVIALLYIDFDLYEPTKTALEHFVPRVPKSGVIVFDETNNARWPGETVAMIEHFGNFNKIKLQKFPFDPKITYCIIE